MPAGLLLLWIGFILRTPREEIIQACVGAKTYRFDQLIRQVAPPVTWRARLRPLAWTFLSCWLFVGTLHSWTLPLAGLWETVQWAPLFILSIYFIIFMHELGHLLVGQAMGMRTLGAEIGGGASLFTISLGSGFLRINANPWSGMAYVYSLSRKYYRLRRIAMLLGGPLLHLCAIAIFAYLFLYELGPANGVFAGGMAWIGIYILFSGSLLPLIHVAPLHLPSDGYHVCGTLVLSDSDVEDSLAQSRTYLAAAKLPAEEAGASLARLHALLSEYPSCGLLRFHVGFAANSIEDWSTAEANFRKARELGGFDPPTLFYIETLEIESIALQCRFGEAEERCAALLQTDNTNEQKVALLDGLACIPVIHGISKCLPEAYAWSAKALELLPDSLTHLGTKGSLLVEMGRFEEAREILSRVRTESPSLSDQGICSLYLGIIEIHAGHRPRAETLLAEAMSKYPAAWLVRRATGLIFQGTSK